MKGLRRRKALRSIKILGMTPGDWGLYFLLLASGTIPSFFDAWHDLFPDAKISVWWFRGIFLVLLVVLGVLYRHQIKGNRKRLQNVIAGLKDERARLAVQQLLEMAVKSMEKVEEKCRANVMLIENDRLVIRCHCRMDDARDRGIKLEKNQGCAGQAWGSRQQMCADLQQVQQTGGPSWNLTPDLRELTNQLKAILSTPIFNPDDPNVVIGVFNIDSELPLQDVGFKDDEISEQAVDYASLFGVWITDILPREEIEQMEGVELDVNE